jgi:hypothetical protein
MAVQPASPFYSFFKIIVLIYISRELSSLFRVNLFEMLKLLDRFINHLYCPLCRIRFPSFRTCSAPALSIPICCSHFFERVSESDESECKRQYYPKFKNQIREVTRKEYNNTKKNCTSEEQPVIYFKSLYPVQRITRDYIGANSKNDWYY